MKFTAPFPSLNRLRDDYIRSQITYQRGTHLFNMGLCTPNPADAGEYRFRIEDRFEDFEVEISTAGFELRHQCNCISRLKCCHHAAAALLYLQQMLSHPVEPSLQTGDGYLYTREEMIARVLQEREERSRNEPFDFTFSDNVWGFHEVRTEAGRIYQISFRDFDKSKGYCSCPDFKTNKLGTCKHLLAAQRGIFRKLPVKKLTETQPYPFIEIYCDPLNDYRITYFYRGSMTIQVASLIERYFGGDKHISEANYPDFVHFLKEVEHNRKILVRPEVHAALDKYFENALYAKLRGRVEIDYSLLKGTLFPYQKQGIAFALFKPGAIIADELGLGKSVQAIAVALFKRDIFGVKRVLVICPASHRNRWQDEIRRYTDAGVAVAEGEQRARRQAYEDPDAYFVIYNYEAVVRDIESLCENPPDMIILDEAQRIRNYTTKTSYAVKAIPKKHSLVLTGTPIADRLGDLYSIMNFIDPEILAPLWEFSMQHCYFDKTRKERITGYHNPALLQQRLENWMIRREKSEVWEQLPENHRVDVPVNLHPKQQELHNQLARSLAPILAKRYKTGYDLRQMEQFLKQMRMVCASTYLIDKETNYAPKLDIIREILVDKLDVQRKAGTIIIYSVWPVMRNLIINLLNDKRLPFVAPAAGLTREARQAIIARFNETGGVFVASLAEDLDDVQADTALYVETIQPTLRPAGHSDTLREAEGTTAVYLYCRNSIEERLRDLPGLDEAAFTSMIDEEALLDEVALDDDAQRRFLEHIHQLVMPFGGSDDLDEPPVEEIAASDELLEKGALFEEDENLVSKSTPKQLDFTEMPGFEKEDTAVPPVASKDPAEPPGDENQRIEATLNQGMQFLSGLMKMATGKELETDERAISIDKSSGEVVLRFKIPRE